MKHFRDRSLLFPRVARPGGRSSEVVWRPLELTTVTRVLHNPRYAGAFAYGRRRTEKRPTGGYRTRKVDSEQWHALVRDAHPGYIEWDEFERNGQQLRRSALAYGVENRRTPPREGPALLQGLVVCGVCGGRMTVRYHDRASGLVPDYQCITGRMHGRQPLCQVIPGGAIDRAVGKRLVEAMTPRAIELTLAVQAQLRTRIEEADRLRQMQVERARHEAEAARRRYMLVDPDNRLVADTLEAEWNLKLRALAQARDEAERQKVAEEATLDEATQERIGALAEDFGTVFNDPSTSHRDRKRMAQLLIEDVTLLRSDQLHVHIRFKGGPADSLVLPLPKNPWRDNLTHPDVVARVDHWLERCDDDHEVAAKLNEEGLRTGAGNSFDGHAVRWVRYAHGLKTPQERLLDAGMLTISEAARRFGLSPTATRRLARNGRLTATRSGRKNTWFVAPLEEQSSEIQQLVVPDEPGEACGEPRPAPPAGATSDVRARIAELVLGGHDDTAIAERLDAEECRTVTGRTFAAASVRVARERWGIKSLWAQQLAAGKLTSSQMAALLGVNVTTINNWAHAGKLRGRRCGRTRQARWALDPIDEQSEPIRQLAAKRVTLPKYHGVLSAAVAARGAV